MNPEFLSIVREAHISAPVTQVIIIIVALSMCLLFRFNRTGLIIAYIYTFYMGWQFCQAELMVKAPDLKPYAAVYLIFGAVVLFLTVISMFRSSDET
jgi:hypothetical protein